MRSTPLGSAREALPAVASCTASATSARSSSECVRAMPSLSSSSADSRSPAVSLGTTARPSMWIVSRKSSLVVRTVELRIGQRAQFDELTAQYSDGGGGLATQRTKRAARGLLARGVDEIGDS